jgi:hypothetical protein
MPNIVKLNVSHLMALGYNEFQWLSKGIILSSVQDVHEANINKQ